MPNILVCNGTFYIGAVSAFTGYHSENCESPCHNPDETSQSLSKNVFAIISNWVMSDGA